MQVKYPIGYDIKAEQTENGNWKLKYIEKFRPEDYDAFKMAAGLLKSHKGDLELESDRIIVSLNDTRAEVLNFLAGEFLLVSGLGETTLAELLATLAMKGLKS